MSELLGGKGANLAEMTRVVGADRVPGGFNDHDGGLRRLRGRQAPDGLWEQVEQPRGRIVDSCIPHGTSISSTSPSALSCADCRGELDLPTAVGLATPVRKRGAGDLQVRRGRTETHLLCVSAQLLGRYSSRPAARRSRRRSVRPRPTELSERERPQREPLARHDVRLPATDAAVRPRRAPDAPPSRNRRAGGRLIGAAALIVAPADAPLVVLIHRLGGSHHTWDRVLPLIEPHARVHALNLTGTGSIEQEAVLAAELIPRPAVLVGHARGGLVATAIAQRHRGLARKLILPCTPWAPESRLVASRPVERALAVPGIGEVIWTAATGAQQRKALRTASAPNADPRPVRRRPPSDGATEPRRRVPRDRHLPCRNSAGRSPERVRRTGRTDLRRTRRARRSHHQTRSPTRCSQASGTHRHGKPRAGSLR